MRNRLASLLIVFASAPLAAQSSSPQPGKYGCTESMPRMRNGNWEYEIETRGFIRLEPGGRYVDPFNVAGRYVIKGDTARFSGGALAGASATTMKGGRLWVVIPTAKKERRWACGPAR